GRLPQPRIFATCQPAPGTWNHHARHADHVGHDCDRRTACRRNVCVRVADDQRNAGHLNHRRGHNGSYRQVPGSSGVHCSGYPDAVRH
ncbi:MAG: hypothetical protein ACK55I_48730, partial [bacterium]